MPHLPDAGMRDGGARDATAPDAGPSAFRRAAEAAIEQLARTENEVGLDVVASLQIYASRRGYERATEVAALLEARLRASEVERYGALLERDKPPLPAASLDGVIASATTPDPLDDLGDDRASRCLEEVLACSVSTSCGAFLELDDRWGYVLTHQAVALLFANWVGCALEVDVEERRRTFAANLLLAMEADPSVSELMLERLAMCAHLGFANEIAPSRWSALLAAQDPSGCFPLGPGMPCHPHATGVAIWALAHAP